MEMNSRSNKGKEKLIEDDDHCPSQNNLPGSDNQQQNFGGGREATEAVVSDVSATANGASCSHSASEKQRSELRPLSDFVYQINPHHLQWTEKLHDHFVCTVKELGRCGKSITPKILTNEMAIDGLTQQHVKSRLQAFRDGRITVTNWQKPRGPRRWNNIAGKIDGPQSASKSASTCNWEHVRNGPGMGDENVGGNLETGTVTAQQQPYHDFNQNKSPELAERSRTVSAGHQQPSQVDVADISAANGYSIPRPYNNSAHWVGFSIPEPYNNSAHWVQPAQAGGVGLQEQTSNGYSIPVPYNNSAHWVQPAQAGGVGLQEQTSNGYSIPVPYNNSAHWVQPAQAGGVGLQEQTSNGYSIPVPYNNSTSSNAINNVQDSLQKQNGVGLHIQTPGFRDRNGFFYPFQPGNDNHWVQFAQNCVSLQAQTPGFRHRNRVYYFEPGNELACVVQPTQYGVGVQEQTPGLLYQNGVDNFQQGNELVVVQQPAQDGGALGNIQQQNQPQAATDAVQAQNGIYNFRSGNEAHRVQQPAHDGGALRDIHQQNQYFCLEPQAATDTVQAQNATAIMPDNMVTTEDQLEDFLNLDSSELGIADFDFSETFGFA